MFFNFYFYFHFYLLAVKWRSLYGTDQDQACPESQHLDVVNNHRN